MPSETMQEIGSKKILEATKRTDGDWAKILDRWGYRKHGQHAAVQYLESRHQLAACWAQAVVLRYELHKGVRQPKVFPRVTPELKRLLEKYNVLERFSALASDRRRTYLEWYGAAKRHETQERRALSIVAKLKKRK